MAKQQTRVWAYVDVGWLLDGLSGQGMPWRLNYGALIDQLAGERTVVGKAAYMALFPGACYPNKEKDQQALLDLMAEQGFETKVCEMQVKGGMYLDLGVDLTLAVDMLEQGINDAYDTALVVSRRPTLRPAVEAVRRIGKEVENAFFEYVADPSNEVKAAANSFQPLTEQLVHDFASIN